MEEERMEQQPEEQQETYVPRPAWQVWGARIALVLFLIVLAIYYLNIFRGGQS